MEKNTDKIIGEFEKKFKTHFEDVLSNYDGDGFLTNFQAWYYVLTHFTNEQIIDFTPDFLLKCFYDPEDYVDMYYDTIVSTFEKSIRKQQVEVIYEIMTTKSVSQGEAMIIADEAFSNEIGYFYAFTMSLYGCFNAMRELIKDADNQ